MRFGNFFQRDTILDKEESGGYVPYQKCPKCDGQGIVTKPPYVAGDVNYHVSSATDYVCNVCNGAKIIPMHKLNP